MGSLKVWTLPALLALLAGCGSDPRIASRKYVENGNAYFSKAKFREASLLYRRALKKDAKCAEAWYRLGLTNHQLGNYAEARKDLARAMDLDPANTDAVVRLGDLDLLFYAADQKQNKALLADLKDLARRLLNKDKRSYDGLRFSGEIALVEKDLAGAIQKFEQANAVKPYQKDLVLALAQALEAGHQDERAEKLAEEMIEHDKTDGAMYDLLFTAYLRTRRLDSAEEILRRKIANNPSEGAYVMQLAFHYYRMHRRSDMQAALETLSAKPGAFPDARLQAGDFYVRIREFGPALAEFELGEREDQKRARVYQKKRVELLASAGRTQEAAEALARILKDDPKDLDAIGLRASLRIAHGGAAEIRQAIAELEPLAQKTANAVLHYNLGRAYLEIGQAVKARAQFSEALRADPQHAAARLGLAELELRAGNNGPALNQIEPVLAGDPVNLTALLLHARVWTNVGEFQKAHADLAAALELNPSSDDARFELGELDSKEGHFEEAQAVFRALLGDGDPRVAPALIESLARYGSWEEALQVFRQYFPEDSAKNRWMYANLLLRAGRYQEAAQRLEALKAENTEELYLKLGEAEAHQGHSTAATAAFQKARDLAPHDPEPEVQLGMLLEQSGSRGEARKAYEAALAAQPDHAAALNNLAYLEADDGVDLDQALIYAQHARAKLPDDVNVMDTLGLIYIKKNLTEDGLRMLHEAVKRRPGSAAFRLHLALALYQKGDRLLARRELEAARRNQPSGGDLRKIQELQAKLG